MQILIHCGFRQHTPQIRVVPKITPCHPCACGHDGKLPVVISFFISSPHHQRTVERESRKLSNFYYKLKNCSEFFSETVKCWEEENSFPKFVSIFSVSALLNSAPPSDLSAVECRRLRWNQFRAHLCRRDIYIGRTQYTEKAESPVKYL